LSSGIGQGAADALSKGPAMAWAGQVPAAAPAAASAEILRKLRRARMAAMSVGVTSGLGQHPEPEQQGVGEEDEAGGGSGGMASIYRKWRNLQGIGRREGLRLGKYEDTLTFWIFTMKRLTSLTGCTRRKPRQQRGEDRVKALVEAAVAEFAAAGYDATTMSAIAARAGASIGSLYQFFPDKQSIARAVRTAQVEDVEKSFAGLAKRAVDGDVEAFTDAFVDIMVKFVDEHPAFLPLLDAPSSTLPVGPRHRLRGQLEGMLRVLQPRLGAEVEPQVAETILHLNRAMLGLYARSAAEERVWVVREYRGIMQDYMGRRLSRAHAGLAKGRTGLKKKQGA